MVTQPPIPIGLVLYLITQQHYAEGYIIIVVLLCPLVSLQPSLLFSGSSIILTLLLIKGHIEIKFIIPCRVAVLVLEEINKMLIFSFPFYTEVALSGGSIYILII